MIVAILIALFFTASIWPAVIAQEATPDEAMLPEAVVTETPATVIPSDSAVETNIGDAQEDPVLPTRSLPAEEATEISQPTLAPAVAPANNDLLQSTERPANIPLQPNASSHFGFDYRVTTPRRSTTIVGEIGGASGVNGLWTIQLQIGGVWSETGNSVRLNDTRYTDAGSAIPLSVIVTAPRDVVVDETITIWLSSSVERLDGDTEQGIVATGPAGSVSVTPLVSGPTLACAESGVLSVPVGGNARIACDITVWDSRAGASLVIEPAAGWLVSSDDTRIPVDRLEFGPFTNDGGTPIVSSIAITVNAPPIANVAGELTIRLFQDSDIQTELDAVTIQLTTIIPSDWELECNADSIAAVPGASALVSCDIPNAAWALRGDHPLYAYAGANNWANDSGNALDNPAFAFSLPVPCSVTNEIETLTVDVDLGHGLIFSSPVQLTIDSRSTSLVPVVTHDAVDFGSAQWLGTSYAPAETTVTLVISGATSPCKTADWSIQLATSSFSDGESEIDPAIAFSTLSSSSATIVPAPDGTTIPGTPVIVVSGTGDGVVVMRMMLSISATFGPGTYTGDIEFSIFTGP